MAIGKSKVFIHVLVAALLVGGGVYLKESMGEVQKDTREVYENMEILTEVLRQIEKNYVEPKEAQELIQGAIRGMVRSLDPHSSYLTKEEHGELMLETKGSFTGVGIEITMKNNVLTVVSPIEGTPAYEAGVKAGDRIIQIGDESTKDMSMMDAVKRIRGPKGTTVKLTIAREDEQKPLEFTITRDVIPLHSVRAFGLAPGIGYIRISNFQSKTADDVFEALEELESDGRLEGLILDMRNNPGGLLSQAIEVSDVFLDSGVIVATKGRKEAQNIQATAHQNKKFRDFPIIVLVNSGSASAAEIVAGALQDNKKALVLGTRTFGKGSVQTILPLSDGSGLRLTTARFYTPGGKSIQSAGITPDIELALVPYEEQNDGESGPLMREENLPGHMPAEKVGSASSEPEENESNGDEKRAEELLKKDNQVRHAVQLLKSWNVFSQIRSHESASAEINDSPAEQGSN